MHFATCIAALLSVAITTADDTPTNWTAYASKEGNFVIDFPGNPTKTFTKSSRSRTGQIKIFVAQCDTPDILYTAEKIEIPKSTGLKPQEMEAILDFWRDDLANDFNGKVIAQKKLRLDSGAYGRDFTIEGRPIENQGLATIRVREYLSQKALYLFFASTAADKELPDDVGHFFASFAVGTNRVKKVGPHPEIAGTPLGTWGNWIDPDNDCKFDDKGKVLEVSIPETHHDLNADNDKLNAPRILREVTGDFQLTVKIDGNFKPSQKSTNPKAVPYQGAGIVIWQDSDNYIFLGRAAINRNKKLGEFAAFEEREWGSRAALNNRGLPGGPVHLRVERNNNRILGYTSADGKNWSRLDPMETSYPSTIKVGIYAINGCDQPLQVRFEDFDFTEGRGKKSKKPAPGKGKATDSRNTTQVGGFRAVELASE